MNNIKGCIATESTNAQQIISAGYILALAAMLIYVIVCL